MEDCFIIMPIAEHDDYPNGHFKHVYDDIIKPGCDAAGYRPVRADDILETNFIHLDILKKLIETPMAICDLSTRNPNVLFELGLRQAFDKPVVLIQEKGTPKIFDIAPLRYTEYRKQRVYHEVIEDQKKIHDALEATKKSADNGQGVNSIVQLLSLTSANLREVSSDDKNPMLQIVRAEMNELKHEFRRAISSSRRELDDSLEQSNDMIEDAHNLVSSAEELITENGDLDSVRKAHNILEHASRIAKQARSIAPQRSKSYIRSRELEMHISSLKEHVEHGLKRRRESEEDEGRNQSW